MITKSAVNEVEPYKTRDGSTIRELMHPRTHGNANQSLAQAVVAVADKTVSHYHRLTEELYYIEQGHGVVTLDDRNLEVSGGDTVLIRPGVIHSIQNTGETDLLILCCCAPAYAHEDTYCID